MNNSRFADKVVWITGASSGIGRATAKAFANAGAEVIVSARSAGALKALAEEIGTERCLALPVDLVDKAARDAAVATALRWRGRINVLVNNAGVSQRARALHTTEEAMRAIMELNFFAQVELTRAVLPDMLERQEGHIVVVSSVTGHVATPLRSTYAASKHALNGYFDALRAELHTSGVGVTMIAPGFVNTNVSRAAITADGSPQGHLEDDIAKGISPETCAAGIVRATARKEREALIGGKEIYAVHFKRFAPGLLAKVITRAIPK